MDNIKMIICDLDGTLLNNQEIISKRTIKVIKDIKNQGYLFGFATGRPIISIESLLSKWKLDKKYLDFVVGLNGGHIKDYMLGTENLYFQIDGHIIKDIMKHFQNMPVNFAVYLDGYLGVYKEDALAIRLANSDNIPYKVIDFDEVFKNQQSKLIVICDPKDMPQVKAHGEKFFSNELKSLQAGKIEYEYMNPKLSKAYSIQQICNLHEISLENVLAFGDADNDADMIKNVGIGVAMQNASQLTKSVANDITDSNEEDGVAKYIEKYILKK